MKFSAIIVALSITGCSGLITGDDGSSGSSGPPELQAAIQKWNSDAYPIFANVCSSCHGGSNALAPWFLKANTPAAMRTLLLGWTSPVVVNVPTPDQSRVLLKGAHEGAQALTPDQVIAISGWITAERDAANAGSMTVELTTPKVDILPCTGGTPGIDATCPINTIKLDDDMLVGASISFVAQATGDDLYLSDIFLKASVDGVYLDHPLFVPWPTTGSEIVDNLDRFSQVKLNLAATTTTPICPGPSCDHIGAGAAIFVGFASSNKLSITFKVLEAAHPGDVPPPPVGCGTNGFASFLTNMKPVLSGTCAGCHGGNDAGAKGAMDLSGLASMTDNNACLQARQHIDTTTPASSTILRPPNGLDNAHPAQGKLTGATNPTLANFTTAVTTWATVEAAMN
jgi:mono/diheme cytochrome c family protein